MYKRLGMLAAFASMAVLVFPGSLLAQSADDANNSRSIAATTVRCCAIPVEKTSEKLDRDAVIELGRLLP